MGLVASQRRLISLLSRKTDIELQAQQISQNRTQLANSTSSLFTNLTNLTPNSNKALQLQSKIAAIQATDKTFELQLAQLNPQREAITAETDGLKKTIEKSIDYNFKGLV